VASSQGAEVGESPEGVGFQLKGRTDEATPNILVDPWCGLAYDTLLVLVIGEAA
jgi:hypothetical protein